MANKKQASKSRKAPSKSSVKNPSASNAKSKKNSVPSAPFKKTMRESVVTMTEMVLPTHTNSLNSIFGGVIMSWIDIAAAICAQRHCQKPVVTASIDDLHFIKPVYKGWVVNLKACVNYTSNTSVEVGVRVDAENPIKGETFHTASAYLTFVALGPDGKPSPVPAIVPETKEELRRNKAAQKRRDWRLERRHFFQEK